MFNKAGKKEGKKEGRKEGRKDGGWQKERERECKTVYFLL